MIAINWQMYEMTHSPVALGMIGVVSFLPILVFSMVAGMTADHVNRKVLLLCTQVFLSVVAVLLAFCTWFGIITPVILFVFLAFQFSGLAFFGPVRQSIIPDLVPKEYLMNAVSLNTLARQSAVIIGPAIGGFLIALYGVQSIYFFNSIALVVAMITILPLAIPAHTKETKSSFDLASFVAGIHFVRKSKIMLSTILLDFFATFFGSATSLLPIFAAVILHVDAKGLGLLYAATSAGAVLAGLILSSVKKLRHQGSVIIYSVLLYGLATIGFGLSTSLYFSMFFLAVAGAGDMVSTIVRNTIRQTITPAYMRGRMVGINILFAAGGPKLGDAEAGFLAAATSSPFSVVIGGVGTIVATLIIVCVLPGLRKFSGEEGAIL